MIQPPIASSDFICKLHTKFAEHDFYIVYLQSQSSCRVLKAWHLYTRPLRYGMGKGRRNQVLKLTPAKVKYIIRAKSDNISSRIISIEMKVSIRTVNRVWGHWVKNKEPLAPRKFGRSKTYLNDADKRLILEISLISISESFDVIETYTKSKIPAQDVSKR